MLQARDDHITQTNKEPVIVITLVPQNTLVRSRTLNEMVWLFTLDRKGMINKPPE